MTKLQKAELKLKNLIKGKSSKKLDAILEKSMNNPERFKHLEHTKDIK